MGKMPVVGDAGSASETRRPIHKVPEPFKENSGRMMPGVA